MKMEIRINSGEELNKLLDALAKDIVDANIYYRLFIGLESAISEFPEEINLSNTFWWHTMQALKEAYLTRLCRIFDQDNNRSLNLVNLLHTIKANLHFFQEPHFRERMKNNAFVSSLAENVRVPTIEELQADIHFAGGDPIVRKLRLWRGNIHAHTGAKVALGKAGSVRANRIEKEEIELLLDQCFSMLNRYMRMYKAVAWSRQVIGHDDYLSLFKFLRLGLERNESDIQKEIDSFVR